MTEMSTPFGSSPCDESDTLMPLISFSNDFNLLSVSSWCKVIALIVARAPTRGWVWRVGAADLTTGGLPAIIYKCFVGNSFSCPTLGFKLLFRFHYEKKNHAHFFTNPTTRVVVFFVRIALFHRTKKRVAAVSFLRRH